MKKNDLVISNTKNYQTFLKEIKEQIKTHGNSSLITK
jgi:hypothetical protein